MLQGASQKPQAILRLSRQVHAATRQALEERPLEKAVTSSFASFIHGVKADHLSQAVRHRSKRMILDSIGVGLVGSTTHVFNIALGYCQTHSMDFDDTWHPATHPSGAVLPALMAASQMLPGGSRPSGMDFLLAFNMGIEVQGRLMHFSKEASNIPKRFHPPSVVATMGGAAATAKLLSLNADQCAHALAIAASLAGALMANAATLAKPLHIGNATRLGMEAALLAAHGMEANPLILDDMPGCSGFSAFYGDYQPSSLEGPDQGYSFLLEKQDIAFKRFPAHLGMHWVADTAIAVRNRVINMMGFFNPAAICSVLLRVPVSKYINRPFPESEHKCDTPFRSTPAQPS
ncbi:hypothetical protein NDU88_006685 [Pleurodeles waltl]|uniref:MmgE/PrpD N-terminal domain-containing protein n=1 Tax=Pleurodeles waltl TaxID=8319 RepID=A0AAV7MEL5_PLEWA|nr:hypothetical protein NDU88_006685 [Pleurodeles waltl]